jgi:hypothetical protein
VLSSDFHCKENDGFRVVPYTQDSSPLIMVFMKSGKKLGMRMKVQGRLMQAQFTEIH